MEGGKLEHQLCDRYAPSEPTLSGYVPMEENESRLKKLELQVAALKSAPAGFVVRESACKKGRCTDAVGVVSREGEMMGLVKKKRR